MGVTDLLFSLFHQMWRKKCKIVSWFALFLQTRNFTLRLTHHREIRKRIGCEEERAWLTLDA